MEVRAGIKSLFSRVFTHFLHFLSLGCDLFSKNFVCRNESNLNPFWYRIQFGNPKYLLVELAQKYGLGAGDV